jgi:hypothetical protein
MKLELGAVASMASTRARGLHAVDALVSVMTSTHTQARLAEARHPLHGVEDGLPLLVRLPERQGLV